MAEVRSLESVVDSYFVYTNSSNPSIRFNDVDDATRIVVPLIIFERCIKCNDMRGPKGFTFTVVKQLYDSRFPSQFILSNLLFHDCGADLNRTYDSFYSREYNVVAPFNKLLDTKIHTVARPR